MVSAGMWCEYFSHVFLSEDVTLPRRIFCPMKATWPVCACEYQFVDEGLADLIERLKEMLDIDATIDDLDTTQEIPAEIGEKSVATGRIHKVAFVHMCCVLNKCFLSHWLSSAHVHTQTSSDIQFY